MDVLGVSEKYADSWRLDHPNFGDVYQTTYAKGVIYDFQKKEDDPITVYPKVKVKIDGEESENYLPIFFHPKTKYWDDDTFTAKAYNNVGGYFEKAWMSFRGDDEVVVMLKEGKPICVLGFADGIPRIGENLIKIVTTAPNSTKNYRFLSCAKDTTGQVAQIFSSGEDNPDGPDGKKLGIIMEITPTITSNTPDYYDVWHPGGPSNQWQMEVGYVTNDSPPVVHWDNYIYFYKVRHTTTVHHVEFSVPVGPIKYLFKFTITEIKVEVGPLVEEYYWFNDDGTMPAASSHDPSGYEDPSSGFAFTGAYAPNTLVEKTHTHPDGASFWVDNNSVLVGLNPNLASDGFSIVPDSSYKVKACQYQKEDDEAIMQNDFYSNFHWYFMGSIKDKNSIQLFVRPHTKAEMIAAGILQGET